MIAGVDVGTQSLKAIILSSDLKIIGRHAVAYQPSYPRPGWAEQDPALWEQALAPAIGGALAQAGCRPGGIAALGIAGQLDGCIAIDRAGSALHPCLIWMDRRAEAEIAGMDGDLVQSIGGVTLDATHMAAKIGWLKANLPDAASAVMFHGPVSYLVSRLTGAHVIDHATASTSMVYGLAKQSYDGRLLDMFGLREAELPRLGDAHASAGRLTSKGSDLSGLPAGITVAVGTGDDFSSTLGAGVVIPGRFISVIGTAEVTGALHPEPVIDAGRLVETHAYSSGYYFIENPGWLSGGALTWFRDVFRFSGFDEITAAAAAVSPGAEGVTFLPALSGAMAPEWIAAARGTFYGLTPAHGAGHLVRAVLEGTAFAMRDVLTRVGDLGLDIAAIRIAGGGGRSALWRQIRADLAGLPVELPQETDTSPLGAALLAAAAAGLVASPGEAAASANPVSLVTEPDRRNRAAYDEAYRRYRDLFAALRPFF